MKERYLLPPRFRTWSKQGWHIYFDPYNFTWARVNDSGRAILENLRDYRGVPEVAGKIASQYGIERDKAEVSVESFLAGLADAGFLHRNVYRERIPSEFLRPSFPVDIYLHLTNKCNLLCSYCYNKTDRETKIKLEKRGLVSPTMGTEEFKELIEKIIRYGVRRVLFTGGEPLLRPDALELVEFARSLSDRQVAAGGREVRLEMLTNATQINDDIARRMCGVLDTVTISLDGHESTLHEAQRGQRTFEPTVRGIRTVISKRNELGASRPAVVIVPALTAQNIRFMKEMFEFSLSSLGADGLAPIIFQAGDHQELSIAQIPSLTELNAAQERTSKYLDERRSKLGIAPPPKRVLHARNHCGVGAGEISIDPGGFVYPCQSLHFNEFICGNVREDDIKDIFDQSPVMKRVRGVTVETLAVCSHCDLKYLCNSGCRATAYNIYREFDHHNELYCRVLEEGAVAKLWGGIDRQVQAAAARAPAPGM